MKRLERETRGEEEGVFCLNPAGPKSPSNLGLTGSASSIFIIQIHTPPAFSLHHRCSFFCLYVSSSAPSYVSFFYLKLCTAGEDVSLESFKEVYITRSDGSNSKGVFSGFLITDLLLKYVLFF